MVARVQVTRESDARGTAPVGEPSTIGGMAVAVAVGFVVGSLTAYAQGWLGSSTSSLANSAGPWALAAFLVARHCRRLPQAIAASTAALVCAELGYAAATEVRGGSNATATVLFWLTAALLAGPPVGVAAAWSTRSGLPRGVGFGVIAGVLIGEGVYGWTTIADTTDWRYWAAEIIVGVAVVVVPAVQAIDARQHRNAGAALATAVAAATVVFTVGRLA